MIRRIIRMPVALVVVVCCLICVPAFVFCAGLLWLFDKNVDVWEDTPNPLRQDFWIFVKDFILDK